MNIFGKLKSDAKTKEEKQLHDKIQKKAGEIAVCAMTGKLTHEKVDEMQLLYDNYFEKYPDDERKLKSDDRIRKLRSLI